MTSPAQQGPSREAMETARFIVVRHGGKSLPIAIAIDAAVKAERDVLAKTCDARAEALHKWADECQQPDQSTYAHGQGNEAENYANFIRARGATP